MKTLFLFLSLFCVAAFLNPLTAQTGAHSPELDQVEPLDVHSAPPRMMTLYEQGFNEGIRSGDRRSGKVGWFLIGAGGSIPFCWLPWAVEPRRPAKPPIQAEAEFNSGFKNGHRAGWKNAHKIYYIAGAVVSGAAAAAVIASQ